MEQWDQDYIDLEEPGHFRFRKDGMGEFVFGTVNAQPEYGCSTGYLLKMIVKFIVHPRLAEQEFPDGRITANL